MIVSYKISIRKWPEHMIYNQPSGFAACSFGGISMSSCLYFLHFIHFVHFALAFICNPQYNIQAFYHMREDLRHGAGNQQILRERDWKYERRLL